ncbi:hypothetical protein EV018_21125 [Citrobacter freundii]|nr:hypothetical protein CUC46_10520 [Citrobacter freundii]AYY47804.1 hypothetical protein EGX89_04100 [Citrobacter freundii]PSM63529.1 hypothetical protein C3K52_06000 [Citrobacter freundii]RYH32396.1 hypothetical protein EV018_21125 [Citrobacter freundii]TCC16401.1 hypothetical protein EY921_10570 [Citrobacter freundii]
MSQLNEKRRLLYWKFCRTIRAYPSRLSYLPFYPWAVLTILTYFMYAAVVPRCPRTNWRQQLRLLG